MNVITNQQLSALQKQQVLMLWNAEYPEKLAYADVAQFDSYLGSLEDATHYLFLNDNHEVKGWMLLFTRNAERWLALIVGSALHKQGVGSALLNMAKQKEPEINGWVIDHNSDIKNNGMPYISPLAFYTGHGFTVLHDIRIDNEKLSAIKIRWKAGQD